MEKTYRRLNSVLILNTLLLREEGSWKLPGGTPATRRGVMGPLHSIFQISIFRSNKREERKRKKRLCRCLVAFFSPINL